MCAGHDPLALELSDMSLRAACAIQQTALEQLLTLVPFAARLWHIHPKLWSLLEGGVPVSGEHFLKRMAEWDEARAVMVSGTHVAGAWGTRSFTGWPAREEAGISWVG